MQQPAKSSILRAQFVDNTPLMNLKPVIYNLSYGGMGLIFAPALDPREQIELQKGSNNIFLEFNLPPSIKKLDVTGRVKWIKNKRYDDLLISIVGIQFVTKTQVLFREIDRFLKAPTPQSELIKNRRFFPRIPLEIYGTCKIKGIKKFSILTKKFEGYISNLSALGALVKISPALTAKELSVMRQATPYVTMKFTLTPMNKTFQIKSRAIHFKNSTQNNQEFTILGLKFIEMSAKDRALLIEYISVSRITFLKKEINLMTQ